MLASANQLTSSPFQAILTQFWGEIDSFQDLIDSLKQLYKENFIYLESSKNVFQETKLNEQTNITQMTREYAELINQVKIQRKKCPLHLIHSLGLL